jgi:hypothetical protein
VHKSFIPRYLRLLGFGLLVPDMAGVDRIAISANRGRVAALVGGPLTVVAIGAHGTERSKSKFVDVAFVRLGMIRDGGRGPTAFFADGAPP